MYSDVQKFLARQIFHFTLQKQYFKFCQNQNRSNICQQKDKEA